MEPRFEFDITKARPAAELNDPDADLEPYDASEQQFAASLEETAPQFVADAQDATWVSSAGVAPASQPPAARAGRPRDSRRDGGATEETNGPALENLSVDAEAENPDTWREEVAAKLTHYRTRRRSREPRYPSLRLKFESSEPTPSPLPPADRSKLESAPRTALAVEAAFPPTAHEVASAAMKARPAAAPVNADDNTARIIPFPRSGIAPPRPLEELAGPVLDRPRILEAPEIAPPPPALGGILIEPCEQPAEEKRLGIELPLQPAPMSRRMLAAGVDALLVTSALALFAYIFLRIAATIPPLKQTAALTIILATVFWTAYQYLLLVKTGTSPGLKLAKLRLSQFDGKSVSRRTRRWRVLASVLSAVSVGLGYAWCILDEDELCWHDRITRTYMAPRQPPGH
jgi:uncharacterized RDD family membrane protein YckC